MTFFRDRRDSGKNNKVMPFNKLPRVEHENHKALAFRVEIRMPATSIRGDPALLSFPTQKVMITSSLNRVAETVSAAGQTDPSAVEMKGFKLTTLSAAGRLQILGNYGGCGAVMAQPTQCGSTRSNNARCWFRRSRQTHQIRSIPLQTYGLKGNMKRLFKLCTTADATAV
jgi:hypothetical protein